MLWIFKVHLKKNFKHNLTVFRCKTNVEFRNLHQNYTVGIRQRVLTPNSSYTAAWSVALSVCTDAQGTLNCSTV